MVRRANPAVSAAKSAELETQAQAWIEGVTGEVFEGEFGEELRDGRRLCNLINAIKPGSVRRVNDSRMPFKQMENVSNFLKACRAVGVPEYSLFETVDLFELKDVGLVVMCLHALGGTAQLNCPDFNGPHLGLKPAQKSPPKVGSVTKTWTAPSTSSYGGRLSPSPRNATAGSGATQAPSPKAQSTTRQVHSPEAPRATSPVRDGRSRTQQKSTSPPTRPPPSYTPSPPRTIEVVPPAQDATAVVASPQSQLPPPPFDESAARWGSGECQSGQPPAASEKTGSSPVLSSARDTRAPPPAYQDPTTGGTSSPKGGVDAREADDSSSPVPQAESDADLNVARDNEQCTPELPPYQQSPARSPPYQLSQAEQTRPKSPLRNTVVSVSHQPMALGPASPESGHQQQQQQQQQTRPESPPHSATASATHAVLSMTRSSSKSISPGRSTAAATTISPPPEAHAPVATVNAGPVPTSNSTRGGGYGLDAELAARREANYDYHSEQEAQEWIEDVTGEPFEDEFGEELRSGRRLCVLINTIKPGAVRRVNDSKMPFKQMENISNFLKACRAVGVAEYSLFETVDLFEGKDLGLVVRCLHALGQTVQKSCPEFQGPRLGIKQTDANKREWTHEQQQQQQRNSSGTMSQLMAGSSKTMERGTIIKQGVTFGASTSGTGTAAVPARWTMGSQATMERTSIVKSGPTFGADYAGTADPASVSSQFTRGYR